jgi:hypothetical protein
VIPTPIAAAGTTHRLLEPAIIQRAEPAFESGERKLRTNYSAILTGYEEVYAKQ